MIGVGEEVEVEDEVQEEVEVVVVVDEVEKEGEVEDVDVEVEVVAEEVEGEVEEVVGGKLVVKSVLIAALTDSKIPYLPPVGSFNVLLLLHLESSIDIESL